MPPVLNENEFYELYHEYLNARGFSMEKINKQKYKTPDLKVYDDKSFQLNEVKIPELIFDPVQGVYVFKTMHSKLLVFIKTALKQFESYDPEHKVPWVITFASNHMQMNWRKFSDAIQGGVEFDGNLNPDFTNTDVFNRMKDKIRTPDIYIWLQVSEDKQKMYQASYYVNPKSKHINMIKYFISTLRKSPLSKMDNDFLI